MPSPPGGARAREKNRFFDFFDFLVLGRLGGRPGPDQARPYVLITFWLKFCFLCFFGFAVCFRILFFCFFVFSGLLWIACFHVCIFTDFLRKSLTPSNDF